MADAAQTSGHWATDPDPKKVAAAAVERFTRFEGNLQQRDLDRMLLATYAYHGCDEDGNETHRVSRLGKDQQVRYLMDNEFRVALQSKLTMVRANPPGFIPVPINTDTASEKTSLLVRGVVDYYLGEGKVDEKCGDATELGELHSWGWLYASWEDEEGPVAQKLPTLGPMPVQPPDVAAPPMPGQTDVVPPPAPGPTDGTQPPGLPPLRPVTGVQEVKAGDVYFEAVLASDVAFDYDARGPLQWLIVRRYVNKFDLAARVEAKDAGAGAGLAKRIREYTAEGSAQNKLAWALRSWKTERRTESDLSDEVAIYEVRHLPTPGCPQGRWLRYLSADIVIDDGPARYGDDLMCHCALAGKRVGTKRGYSTAHDALALQRALDTLSSIPYSNQAAGGLNILVAKEGSELRAENLFEGTKVLYGVGDDPSKLVTVLELVRTPPEVFAFRDSVKSSVDEKMGMNAQSMGRDDRDLAGVAMALLDDTTQRNISSTAQSHTETRTFAANAIIRLYKRFGRHSRKLAMLVGKSKQPMLQKFSGEDFESIDRVVPEPTSALTRTPAGRLGVAQMLIEAAGKGVQPELILSVTETGKYEPLTEDPMAEILTIREENERLMSGEVLDTPPPPVDPVTGQPIPPPPGAPPPVSTAMYTDNPLKHIMGHRPVLSSTAARKNSEVVRNTRMHLEAHVRDLMAWISGDPLYIALHGPPPQGLAPPAPPPGEGEGGGKKAGGGEGGPPKAPPAGAGSAPGGGQTPPTPVKPSGERWSPTGEISTQ